MTSISIPLLVEGKTLDALSIVAGVTGLHGAEAIKKAICLCAEQYEIIANKSKEEQMCLGGLSEEDRLAVERDIDSSLKKAQQVRVEVLVGSKDIERLAYAQMRLGLGQSEVFRRALAAYVEKIDTLSHRLPEPDSNQLELEYKYQ